MPGLRSREPRTDPKFSFIVFEKCWAVEILQASIAATLLSPFLSPFSGRSLARHLDTPLLPSGALAPDVAAHHREPTLVVGHPRFLGGLFLQQAISHPAADLFQTLGGFPLQACFAVRVFFPACARVG